MSIFFRLSWHFNRWKNRILESIFFAKQGLITRTSFVYKTTRLVRICLLISALDKRVLLFFSVELFYKSNRKLFSCVCISWYKHEKGWANSRQLCKPSTSSRVYITVSNSPNPSRVYIGLCKHGKRFLLIKSYYTDCLWRLRYSWTFVHIKHKLVFTSFDARMFVSVV